MTCEIILCNQPDPPLCSQLIKNDCLKIAVFYYCPHMCGICPSISSSVTTTIPSINSLTTKKSCSTNSTCMNGGQQNHIDCSCECKKKYKPNLNKNKK